MTRFLRKVLRIVIFARVSAAGDFRSFSDYSYALAPTSLDAQHLNNLIHELDFHGVLVTSLKDFDQHWFIGLGICSTPFREYGTPHCYSDLSMTC